MSDKEEVMEKKEEGTSKNKERDILEELLKSEKKEVRYARIAAFFTFGLFVILLVVAIIIVPKVVSTLNNINDTVTSAYQTIEGLDEVMDNINSMSTSIEKTSENMNDMITDNATELTGAVEKLGSIDYEGLNQAITDLQDAVGPFATFMNRFK